MEQKFTFDIGVATHPGQKRPVNEDALLPWVPTESQQLRERGALFIVADGMGAYGHGAVAAEKVIQYTKDNYYLAGQPIRQAVEQANVQIYQYAQDHPENEGMGTTIVGVLCHPDGRFQAFNVGDSRAYLLRNGQIVQISNDHSVVARRVEKEGMSWAEAAKLGKTNQLTRSIGRKPVVEVEVKPVELFGSGDVFLLCSDGLWRDVTSEEIQQYVTAAATAQDAATQLVNLSNSRGGADNITVLVVRCVGQGAQKLTSMPAWATVPVSFDEPSATAKVASKPLAGKPNALLAYGLIGLGVLGVIALALVVILSGQSSQVSPNVQVSVPTNTPATKEAAIALSSTNAPLPTSNQSGDTLAYQFSLEIVSPNDNALFEKSDVVELKWIPPANVTTTLPTGQVYLVQISYTDSTGITKTIPYTSTDTMWRLPSDQFFSGEIPIAKGAEYSWQVAVVDASSSTALSPWTKPPYTLVWSANAATLQPRGTTASVAQPGVTPASTLVNTPEPSCPPGQFLTILGCRSISDPKPTCPNGTRPDGSCM